MWETIINLFMYHSVYYIYIYIIFYTYFYCFFVITDYYWLCIITYLWPRWSTNMSPSRLPPVNPICWEGLEFRENSWSGSGGEHRSIKFHGNACVVVGACEGPKTPKISKESTHTNIYIYMCVCMYTPCIYTSIYRYCMNLACFCLSGAKRASDLCALQFWAILGDRPT